MACLLAIELPKKHAGKGQKDNSHSSTPVVRSISNGHQRQNAAKLAKIPITISSFRCHGDNDTGAQRL
jgi:hypothetical protein